MKTLILVNALNTLTLSLTTKSKTVLAFACAALLLSVDLELVKTWLKCRE
jgi:hypothetical protein